MIFTKQGVLRPVVVPKYRNIPIFIIKNDLRTAGMSRDRYFELLDGVYPGAESATAIRWIAT